MNFKKKLKSIGIILILLTILLILSIHVYGEDNKGQDIYVIPIKGNITKASYNFLDKNVKEILPKNPKAIIFEIDTYGGLVDEAIKIKDLIISLDIPTIAFVNNKAESAGVLLTISAEKVVMSNTATIGSAETIPNTEKILSMWRGVLRDTAQYRNRDALIIESMADKDIEIDNVIERGKLLNLTSKEALKLKVSDFTTNSYDEIVKHFDLGEGQIIKIEEDLAIKLSKHISNPYLSTFLLTMGFIGIVTEVITAGFGFGISISVISFGLYFGGNIMAGYASLTTLIIFITGIVLLFIELIIPGFGLPGISGIILVITSIFLGVDSMVLSFKSVSIALGITALIVILLVKFGFKSKRLNRIILKEKLDKENDFVPSVSKEEYLEKEGRAITSLRPSGYAEIDGDRLDVLSDEGFIKEGESVKVIRVEGTKIFVRRI